MIVIPRLITLCLSRAPNPITNTRRLRAGPILPFTASQLFPRRTSSNPEMTSSNPPEMASSNPPEMTWSVRSDAKTCLRLFHLPRSFFIFDAGIIIGRPRVPPVSPRHHVRSSLVGDDDGLWLWMTAKKKKYRRPSFRMRTLT